MNSQRKQVQIVNVDYETVAQAAAFGDDLWPTDWRWHWHRPEDEADSFQTDCRTVVSIQRELGGSRSGRLNRAPGGAGPVRGLLGGKASPATFVSPSESRLAEAAVE